MSLNKFTNTDIGEDIKLNIGCINGQSKKIILKCADNSDLSLQNTSIGSINNVLLSDGGGGVYWGDLPSTSGGLYSETQTNEIITPQTDYIILGTGLKKGSLIIPSNTLDVNYTYEMCVSGVLSAGNNDEFSISLVSNNNVNIGDANYTFTNAVNNSFFELRYQFMIGATGTATNAISVCSSGFKYQSSNTQYHGNVINFTNNNDIDTTITNNINLKLISTSSTLSFVFNKILFRRLF